MVISMLFAPFSALVQFLVMLSAKPNVFLVTAFPCHCFLCGATGVDAAVPPSPAPPRTAAHPPPIPGGYPTGNVAALYAAAACRASTALCAAAVVAAIAAVSAGTLPPPPPPPPPRPIGGPRGRPPPPPPPLSTTQAAGTWARRAHADRWWSNPRPGSCGPTREKFIPRARFCTTAIYEWNAQQLPNAVVFNYGGFGADWVLQADRASPQSAAACPSSVLQLSSHACDLDRGTGDAARRPLCRGC